MAAVILTLCVCCTLLCPKPLNPSGKQHGLLHNTHNGVGGAEEIGKAMGAVCVRVCVDFQNYSSNFNERSLRIHVKSRCADSRPARLAKMYFYVTASQQTNKHTTVGESVSERVWKQLRRFGRVPGRKCRERAREWGSAKASGINVTWSSLHLNPPCPV